MQPLTKAERARCRSQISMTLANLGADGFRLYWYDPMRRLVARSIAPRRRFRVPDDAVLVGTYASGIPARDVLGDLEELLARFPASVAALTAPADPCERPTPEPETPAPAAPAGAGAAIKAQRKRPHAGRPLRGL